jgi:hypothetical protein
MDGAGAQLDLFRRAVDEQLPGFDRLLQAPLEPEDAVDAEDLRDEVVGEGGEAPAVGERGEAGAVDVGGGQLGALEERHPPASVGGDVGEGLPRGEHPGEADGGTACVVDHGLKAAAVIDQDVGADLTQGCRELGHQRMVGVLADHLGDLGGVELDQLPRRPGSCPAEALGDSGGDREVAAAGGPLADRRPPAGAEIDRVEADGEGGASLAIAVEQFRLRVWIGEALGGREGRRIPLDRHLLDPHRARPLRDPGAGRADFVRHRCSGLGRHRITVAGN